METYEDEIEMRPCWRYLTFAPWIYLVPQYKPESILMLGYSRGSVAGLVRLLYGDVPITAVDINPIKDNPYNITFIQADAEEFVKTCGHFDTVIVDTFYQIKRNPYPCKFVTDPVFIANLERIANYIIVNTLKDLDMKNYSHLRRMGMNSPSGNADKIYYYEVNDIPNLHPFKK